MTITVKVEGGEQVVRGLAAANSNLAGDIRKAMTSGLLLVEADARRGVPQDTRQLSGSIVHEINGHGMEIVGQVGPSRGYGFFVHEGRRPGRMPPVKALEGWARRHNMNAFLVARAIGRRGIRPNPYMTRALEKNKSKIEALFSKLGLTVASRVVSGH